MPVPHSGASFGWLYCRKMLKRLLGLALENCLYLAEMCGCFCCRFLPTAPCYWISEYHLCECMYSFKLCEQRQWENDGTVYRWEGYSLDCIEPGLPTAGTVYSWDHQLPGVFTDGTACNQDCLQPGLPTARTVYSWNCQQLGLFTAWAADSQDCLQLGLPRAGGLFTAGTVYSCDCPQPRLSSTRTVYNWDCLQPGLFTAEITDTRDCLQPGQFIAGTAYTWDQLQLKVWPTDHEVLAHPIAGTVTWGGGLWRHRQVLRLHSRLVAAGCAADGWSKVKGWFWALRLHHHPVKVKETHSACLWNSYAQTREVSILS